MMNLRIRFRLLLRLLPGGILPGVLLFSCGLAPPRSAEYHSVFSYAKDKLKEIETSNYQSQAQGKAMSLYRKVPYIIVAQQGQSFQFVQQATPPRPDTLVYALGDGRYRLTRDLYMSLEGKDNLLSFDRQHWFNPVTPAAATEAANAEGKGATKGPGNLDFRLKFEVASEDSKRLRVNYWAELVVAPQLTYEDDSELRALEQRPVLHGSSGDFIVLMENRTGKNKVLTLESSPYDQSRYDQLQAQARGRALQLQENIVFFPKGFEFYYRLYLLGNILQAVTDGPVTEAHFLRDIYFYYPRRLFASVSFDGKSWSPNYFQFRLKAFNTSVFLDPQNLQYADGVYIYYKR